MSVSTSVGSITQLERTYKAVLSTPYKGTYSLTLFRERIYLDANSNQVGVTQPLPPITVDASSLANMSVTIGGVTYSGAGVEAALPLFFDQVAAAQSA